MSNHPIITIHDIPGLKYKIDNLDKLVTMINYGGFGYINAYVVSSLSVGYPTQMLDPSYTFDVDGTVRITEKTYLLDDLLVDNNVEINGSTTMNGTLRVNASTYLNSNTFITGNLYLWSKLDVLGNASFHSNMEIGNNLFVNNNATVFGNEYLYQTLNVSGNVSMHSNLELDHDLNVSGNCILLGNEYLYQTLNVSGNVSMHSNLQLDHDLNVSGNCILLGNEYLYQTLNVSGNVSLHSNLELDHDLNVSGNCILLGNEYLYQTLNVSGNVSMHSNLQLDHDLNVSGNCFLLGNEYLYQTLNVSGNVSLHSNLELDHDLNVSGNVFLLGNEYLYQRLNVSGNVSMHSNLELDHDLNVSGNCILLGNEYLYQTLNVSGNVSLHSNLELDHDLNVSGDCFLLGNEYLYQTLNVSGNVSMHSNLEVDDDLFVNNNVTVFGNEYLYQNLDVSGNVSLHGITHFYSGTTFNSSVISYDSFTIKNKSSSEKNASFHLGVISNDTNDSVVFDSFAHGTQKFDGGIIIGKGDTGFLTTFDLSANHNLYGIKYDGPINIGKNTSNIFNLDASDGTINYKGNINVFNELRIKPGGKFIIEASLNSITLLETNTEITSQLNVSNNGTCPALIVNQTDSNSYDIVNFQDNDENVFTVGYDGDTQIRGRMKLGYPIVTTSNHHSIDDSDHTLNVSGNTAISGDILLTGNIMSYSDARVKTNITPLTDCLTHLDLLGGYKYNRVDSLDKDKVHIGLIAQEVESVYPELIYETHNIKSVNYLAFNAILLEGIKELKQQNKELTERIEMLENKE